MTAVELGPFNQPSPLLIPHPGLTHPRTQPPLAMDAVRYAGELVAFVVADDRYVAEDAVGLIDVECEAKAGTICEQRPDLGGMIWHLAVHPDHQRRGVATGLLLRAESEARDRGLSRLEAWTRDDPGTRAWYEARGFEHVQSYAHVYVDLDERARELFPASDGIRPVRVFAHALADPGELRARFRRVHEAVLYERRLI